MASKNISKGQSTHIVQTNTDWFSYKTSHKYHINTIVCNPKDEYSAGINKKSDYDQTDSHLLKRRNKDYKKGKCSTPPVIESYTGTNSRAYLDFRRRFDCAVVVAEHIISLEKSSYPPLG